MLRRLLLLALLLTSIASTSYGADTPTITSAAITNPKVQLPNSFTFTGSGFGHGVGLSQIGAKGMALAGKSAVDILQYFYTGVQVEPVVDTQTIKVNIAHQQNKLTINLKSTGANDQLLIFDTNSATSPIATLGSGDTLTATITNGAIALQIQNSLAHNSTSNLNNKSQIQTLSGQNYWQIRWQGDNSYIGVKVNSTLTLLKYGDLELFGIPLANKVIKMEAVTDLSLHDQYLLGLGEVSNGWLPAAVEAQVIASRTYAYSRVNIFRPECQCNLYGSIYDQTYVGYAKELEFLSNQFQQDIAATDSGPNQGLIITYQHKPISAYFFSSDGGKTQSAKDVWGVSYPYLVPVNDPYSINDKLNPGYAHWQRTYSEVQVANLLGMSDVVRLVPAGVSAAGANLKVVAYSAAGVKKVFTVSQFKTTVLLPSSWFNIKANFN
jgi:stage II sporulation protein D